MNKFPRIWIFAVLLSLITLAIPGLVHADDTSSSGGSDLPIFQAGEAGRVGVGARSVLILDQVLPIAEADGHSSLYFRATLQNNDGTPLYFDDYWVYVEQANGAALSPQLLDREGWEQPVEPGSQKSFEFVAESNDAAGWGKSSFHVIAWDFTAPDDEQPLGDVAVPKPGANVVPAENRAILTTDVGQVELGVLDATHYVQITRTWIQYTLQVHNTGSVMFDGMGLSDARLDSRHGLH